MKSLALIRCIGVLAAGIILVLAWLLIPTILWTPAMYASVATLVAVILSAGVFGPATIPASRTDAAALGSMGPLAALFVGCVALSISAIKLAFTSSLASISVVVLTFGVLIAGALFIRASATAIQDVAESSGISFQTGSIIAVLQSAHDAQDDNAIRQRLEQLIQDVRFGSTPHEAGTALFHEILELGSALTGGCDNTPVLLASLERKIIHRQRLLLQARSRV